jgi:hypothetical protein
VSNRPADDGLVLGDVPLLARLTGVVLVLAGLAGVAALFPTYLVVGGEALRSATGIGGVVAGLLVPVAQLAVGAFLARGAVPKLGARSASDCS